MRIRKLLRALTCVLALATVLEAHGAVYRYQDDSGRWHFTDKPPADAKKAAVGSVAGQSRGRDIQQELTERFKPANDVARASLSVVTVETAAGSGSGFFVTEDGYIVTNRHVVRPTTPSRAEDIREDLAERQERLDAHKADLKDEGNHLEEMRMTIDEERDYAGSGSASSTYRAQYERYVKRYVKDKERYEEHRDRYREMEREFRKAKSDFGFTSSLTHFSKKFVIRPKNDNSMSATLVRISKNHDLALLKVDNCISPKLEISGGPGPRQGARVFAIGSPLGISDALTTAIITRSSRDFRFTDTRLLPGNSGGPLIDPEGRVIGVNTAVVSTSSSADGLGVAIYARHIRSEFSRELAGKL